MHTNFTEEIVQITPAEDRQNNIIMATVVGVMIVLVGIVYLGWSLIS